MTIVSTWISVKESNLHPGFFEARLYSGCQIHVTRTLETHKILSTIKVSRRFEKLFSYILVHPKCNYAMSWEHCSCTVILVALMDYQRYCGRPYIFWGAIVARERVGWQDGVWLAQFVHPTSQGFYSNSISILRLSILLILPWVNEIFFTRTQRESVKATVMRNGNGSRAANSVYKLIDKTLNYPNELGSFRIFDRCPLQYLCPWRRSNLNQA